MNEEQKQQLIEQKKNETARIMAVKRTDLASIWFVSETHFNNFVNLIDKFHAQQNSEYASAIYICAHPEVFNRIEWNKQGTNPLNWYWGVREDNDDTNYLPESEIVNQLSSSYRALVRAAVECFTSSKHRFDLSIFIGNAGDEVYRLFIQMLEIRRDRHIIDLWNEL